MKTHSSGNFADVYELKDFVARSLEAGDSVGATARIAGLAPITITKYRKEYLSSLPNPRPCRVCKVVPERHAMRGGYVYQCPDCGTCTKPGDNPATTRRQPGRTMEPDQLLTDDSFMLSSVSCIRKPL